MRFVKAHGAGNDFVVVPDWNDELTLDPALVRAVCDRRRGIGADGVLRIVAAPDGADAFMDYRNADGSVADTCGNGVRVVAKHLVERGLVADASRTLHIATRAGVVAASVETGRDATVTAVTVAMGHPVLDPAEIPFHVDGDRAVDVPVSVDGHEIRVTAVSMGNPHAVVVVDDVGAAPVTDLGPALETHPRFPKRTNVEFVEVVAAGRVRIRVWERGVGETAACGTGACAALVALQLLDLAGTDLIEEWPGGELTVRYDPGEDRAVLLRGPAVEVAEGELNGRWLAEVAGRR
ncbi:MAG: diaminopimelate epimerase [Actinobacteria bacterium]|nr:diaminopimelate epimerase [Actinomycetota bacterium]